VALKVFRDDQPGVADWTERLEREARTVARLRHPHIVPFHETGAQDGWRYLDMELVCGETLEARLGRGPLSFRESAELVRKLAGALDYAHGLGIVHRDVKPSNVILDERGEPQLTDFGLARRRGGETTLTAEGQIVGTLAYLSPEQAGGGAHRADGRADTYSLGVVLYRLLTGRLPFPDQGELAGQLYDIIHTEPARPRSLNPAVPRDLETICLKALAKEPGERFATAAAFVDELRRWLNDETLSIRRPRWWEQGWRWARRNRLTAAALVATLWSLVAGGTLGGMAWVQFQRAAEAREARSREESLRAQDKARALLDQARQRVRTPTQGRRMGTLDLLRRLAGLRQQIRDETVRERLDLQARSVLAEALGVPDLVVAEQADLPEWPFAAWRTAMHPSGKKMAIGTPSRPLLWRRGETLRPPAAPQLRQRPPRLAYSPDGRYLAYAPAEGGLQLWDEEASRPLAERRPAETGSVLTLGFAPGGETLWVCCANGQVQSLSLPDLRPGVKWQVDASSHRLTAAAFNADAGRLAVGDEAGRVRLYGADGMFPPARSGRVEVEALAWSPDSRLVAVGTKDGKVQLWPAKDGPPSYPFVVGNSGVRSIQFSPDCRWVLAGDPQGGMRMWDVVTGGQLLTGYYPRGLAKDGRFFAGSSSSSVVFGEFVIPRAVRRLSGHRAGVARLAWSRNNRQLVSLDTGFEARVWDGPGANCIDTFPVPAGDMYVHNADVALSEDSRTAAYASGGERKATALLRDVVRGEDLGQWPLRGGGYERLAAVGGKFLLVREEDLAASRDDDHNLARRPTRGIAYEWVPGEPPAGPREIRPSGPGDVRRFLDHGLTPDGRYYWWVGPRLPEESSRVEVREVATGMSVLEKLGLSTPTARSAFLSSDGRYLWVSADNKDCYLYDLADAGRPPERVPSGPGAYSPGSRWQVLLA
jgi:WD40 repeat protein